MAATEHYGDFAPVRPAGGLAELAPFGYVRAPLIVLCQDHVQLASGVEAESKIYAGDVSWDAIPIAHLSTVTFDDAGTGQSLDFGDANDPDALIDGTDIATAAGSASLMASVDRANFGKRMWQLLGYATREAALATRDKARLYFTVKAANLGAATDLYWCLVGTHP